MANCNKYREKLVQQIKDAGQELINRAESMVHPDLDLITDFCITLSFPRDAYHEIIFSTSVMNKTTRDRILEQTKVAPLKRIEELGGANGWYFP